MNVARLGSPVLVTNPIRAAGFKSPTGCDKLAPPNLTGNGSIAVATGCAPRLPAAAERLRENVRRLRCALKRGGAVKTAQTAGARSYGCYTDPGLFGLRGRDHVGAESGLTARTSGGNGPDDGRRDPSKPLHNCIKRNQSSTRWGPNGYRTGTELGECELVRYHVAMKLRSGSGHRFGRNAAAKEP